MKVQHLKRNDGGHTVCSGSYVHGLDTIQSANDVASAVVQCNGRQGLFIVGNEQSRAKKAIKATNRQTFGFFRLSVKDLGPFSSTSRLFLVKAKHIYG